MKRFFHRLAWVTVQSLVLGVSPLASAQNAEGIYRCGNEYTNQPSPVQLKDCKPVQGASVTVVQMPKTLPVANAGTLQTGKTSSFQSSAATARVDPNDQRARDNDAKQILETELAKAQARLSKLQQEYNNGEPERRGDEARNFQKYLDRVSDLKAELARTEADVAGIKREIARATTPR